MSTSRTNLTNSECPDEGALRAFALGTLSERQIEDVGDHLKTCVRCQRLFSVLEPSDDSLVAFLKRPKGDEPETHAVRDLTQRLGKLHKELSDSLAWLNVSPYPPEAESCNYDAVPDRLGQYRLVEVIGRGSMGTVYRAWHSKLKRVVAVKLLSPKRLNDKMAVARFAREMEAIGKLDDHPNIVRARDAGETDGHHFLVMDFVDGIDAGLLVFREGKLSIANACEITRQAALGLGYAHQRGIVHRDVKPSNLLISRMGETRVSDLGLVAFGSESRDAGSVVGTADYMAPEQWAGAANADCRADIYGLGCTLYKLLVGIAPFSDPSHDSRDKMSAHLKARIPLVSAVVPEATSELDAIVSKMLAKKPNNRFESARDVVAALEPFAVGSDLSAIVRRVTSAETDTDRIGSEITFVDQRTVANKKRLTRVRWRKAITVITGAVMLLALGSWAFLIGPTKPSNELAARGPQSLLLQRPDEVRWQYDAEKDTLNLDTDGLALFRQGVAESREYTIRTTMAQERWKGSGGVFFGYKKNESGSLQSFHLVGVQHFANAADGRAEHQLFSSVVDVDTGSDGGATWTWSNQKTVPITINTKTPRHTLEVTVVDGRLTRVNWDGEYLMDAQSVDTDADPIGGHLGEAYGVFGKSGVTVFEKAHLQRYLDPKQR